MTEQVASSPTPELFQVTQEMCPATDHEANARIHYYAALMTTTIADVLKEAIMAIRNQGPKQEREIVREAAQKEFSQSQLIVATKEVCLNWLQQDAMEQGGESMPEWLVAFFQAAANAIDYKFPDPPLARLAPDYQFCLDKEFFCRKTAEKVCLELGFADLAGAFDQVVEKKLVLNLARQNILQRALSLPMDQILQESLW